MHTFFIILRILTGLTSLGAFTLICLIVFLRNAATTFKEGLQVIGYVSKLFATAFTEGTAPKTTEWEIGLLPIAIGVVAVAMFASVFTPGARWFLHVVCVLAVAVMIGYARMLVTESALEILCLPFLVVWFAYYAMGIFWRGEIAAP